MMDILGKMTEKIGTPFLRSLVVGYFQRYAGPDAKDLRTAIILDIDIWQLWCDNCESEGIYTPEQARAWAKMFPSGRNLLTVTNLKLWLQEENCQDILRILDKTAGSDEWLRFTLKNFTKGLWD
jgi:hypothetical protein